jgi:hypothetical protein
MTTAPGLTPIISVGDVWRNSLVDQFINAR